MDIVDAMTTVDQLVIGEPDDELISAIKKMSKNKINSIVVMNGDDVHGIITSYDVMDKLAKDRSEALNATLDEVMKIKGSDDLISINENQSLEDAIQEMEKASTHHLLVHKNGGKPAGILSSYDIIRERSIDIDAHPWISSRNY